MAKIRRSDKLEFINRFNTGTKREFVGKPVDLIGEPQAWEAVVLPLNYARKITHPYAGKTVLALFYLIVNRGVSPIDFKTCPNGALLVRPHTTA